MRYLLLLFLSFPAYANVFTFSDTKFADGTAVVGSFTLEPTFSCCGGSGFGGELHDLDVSAHGVKYTLQDAGAETPDQFHLISIIRQSPTGRPLDRLDVYFSEFLGFFNPANSYPVFVLETLNGAQQLASGTLVREGDLPPGVFIPEPAMWLWLAVILFPLLRWRS